MRTPYDWSTARFSRWQEFLRRQCAPLVRQSAAVWIKRSKSLSGSVELRPALVCSFRPHVPK